MKRLVIGITGASGSIYAKNIIEKLAQTDYEVNVVITKNGLDVFQYELDLDIHEFIAKINNNNIIIHENSNMFSTIASGTFDTEGMIILPASMATIAKIACGISDNLLCRAADVAIKEGRKLIICPREAPFSEIHLKNMQILSGGNNIIYPLFPAFYRKPMTIEEIVEGSTDRILKFFKINTQNKYEWGMER